MFSIRNLTRLHKPTSFLPKSTRFYSPLPRSHGSKGSRSSYQRKNPNSQWGQPEQELGSSSSFQPEQLEFQTEPNTQRYSFDSYTGSVPNPQGLLRENDGITKILNEPTIVIERQIEMMNVFLGFEQANQYTIMDALGNKIGYMAERDLGFTKAIMRQIYRLHRPFHVDVFDIYGNQVLTIKRPFSFINSHIKAILPGFEDSQNLDAGIIGESVQSWHLWRRRYNLFKAESTNEFEQFGEIDSGFLAFDFPVRDSEGRVIGAVDRNWVGIGREMFTDTGVYIIRMDPQSFAGMGELYPEVAGPLTLDQRAVLLGNAISVDFDYFSRHSNRGGLFSFGDYE
ncbi:Phospholipid scramblase 2 [Wickerhamomyces ciferrii]|uniref:Phospholipid scramblase n=1 Tax=Wickerhamomyces ciferrii (strain ATCC 14091 / BCRC 22168 / CBS 111 / JCM 3599 / NBRC 0793 / NRRL Y-1031 F-60-10) TaxID=1206466 RepID=K0KAR6_WICCF|nr:Phospholipid scramblase 2 [Wickerhamomyces ciferrii]CCH42090.1 Phospholipid scramblase 2 [Wickerhamomyces ciferrii]